MERLRDFCDYLFTRQRWVIHIYFWMLILAFYVVFFGHKNSNYLQTFLFVFMLMPVTIGTTYFLNYFLIPQYLMKERYGFFFLYFVYTLIGSTFFEMSIAMVTFVVLAEVKIRSMSPASINIFFLLTSLLMVVFFGVAIKMLLHWRKSKEDYQRLMLEKVEAELKFLKTQLNPHFLFNTLNNLYYLASEKSDRTPQAILALSEILDYVLKDARSVYVPLDKELKQVENYIALELLRYEDRVKVETLVRGSSEGCNIAPMMLITLIENAFKHGAMRVTGESWIKMKVECSLEKVDISLQNSCKQKSPGKGVGLENLRSQLNHLYSERHTLLIHENCNVFLVNLTLLQR